MASFSRCLDLFTSIKFGYADLNIPKIMDGWIKEVQFAALFIYMRILRYFLSLVQMGYPVITVVEKAGGIHIRQDRFLESGPAPPEHNKTVW